jgi:hypothetical protein
VKKRKKERKDSERTVNKKEKKGKKRWMMGSTQQRNPCKNIVTL